jgi:hypothetical protein
MSRSRLVLVALIFSAFVAGIGLAVVSRRDLREMAGPNVDKLYQFDFGPVIVPVNGDTSREIAHEFTIRNESSEQTLRLSPKSKTCGCIEAKAWPDVVPPLQLARVRVAFHPSLVSQERREFVVFQTNQTPVETIGFLLTANVFPALELEHEETIQVGREAGAVAEITVVVHSADGQPKSPLVTATRRDVKLREGASSIRGVGRGITRSERTYTVELTENALQTLRSLGQVSVDLVAKAGEGVRMGQLRFEMPRVVRSTPSSLFFRSEGDGDSRVVELASDAPFEVLEVSDSAHLLRVRRLTEGRLHVHRLEVSLNEDAGSYQDGDAPSVKRTDLIVTTGSVSEGHVVIRVYVLSHKESPSALSGQEDLQLSDAEAVSANTH